MRRGSNCRRINVHHFFPQFVDEFRLVRFLVLRPLAMISGEKIINSPLTKVRALRQFPAAGHDCRGKGQTGRGQASAAVAARQDFIDI